MYGRGSYRGICYAELNECKAFSKVDYDVFRIGTPTAAERTRRAADGLRDHAPPTLSGCPGGIETVTDGGQPFYATVNWSQPRASDGVDGALPTVLSFGSPPLSRFARPAQLARVSYSVIYTAVDSAFNARACVWNGACAVNPAS